MFNGGNTLEDFRAEIKKDWQNLGKIPAELIPSEDDNEFGLYLELCALAIKDAPDALRFVKPPEDKNNISDGYLDLYLMALNHNLATASQVKYLPLPDVTKAEQLTPNQIKLLEKAVALSPLYVFNHLEQIKRGTPLYEDYLDFFKHLIDLDEPYLQENLGRYLPRSSIEFSEKEQAIYQYLAKIYPSSLKNIINEHIRRMLVQSFGVEFFIKQDWTLLERLPHEFRKEAEDMILVHFKDKSYFIITPPDPLEGEFKDSYLTYSNHPKRQGRCVLLPSDFKQIKMILNLCTSLNNEVNLVFIGHTLDKADSICDINAPKMLELVQACSTVTEITLLGCKTAVLTSKPDEEQELISNYLSQVSNSGFCLHHESILTDPNYHERFKKIITGMQLSSGFILIDSAPAKLYFVDKESGENPTTFLLDDNQRKKLIEFVSNKTLDKVKLPSSKMQQVMLRAQNKGLLFWQIEAIFDLAQGRTSKYDRAQSQLYKKDKERFPFLRSITLPDSEHGKINLECLLGRVVKEFKVKHVRPITIKAYLGVVHVDTKELRFYSLHSGGTVYNAVPYNQSFFGTNTNYINQAKLLEEQKNEVKELDKGKFSVAKSVRVKL